MLQIEVTDIRRHFTEQSFKNTNGVKARSQTSQRITFQAKGTYYYTSTFTHQPVLTSAWADLPVGVAMTPPGWGRPPRGRTPGSRWAAVSGTGYSQSAGEARRPL